MLTDYDRELLFRYARRITDSLERIETAITPKQTGSGEPTTEPLKALHEITKPLFGGDYGMSPALTGARYASRNPELTDAEYLLRSLERGRVALMPEEKALVETILRKYLAAANDARVVASVLGERLDGHGRHGVSPLDSGGRG